MSTVQLSNQTYSILENFSTINSSIVFKKGNTIKTIANAENVLAEYEGEEYWPRDFAIYDLSQFLSAIRTLKSQTGELPILEFLNEDYVVIRSKGASVRYYYSDPEITLKVAPDKTVNFPGANIEFDFPQEQLKKVLDLSNTLTLRDLTFASKDEKPFIRVSDRENDTSNKCKFDLSNAECTGDYNLHMKMDNLLVYTKGADYRVRVSDQMLSEWTVTRIFGNNEDVQLKYFVALEPK